MAETDNKPKAVEAVAPDKPSQPQSNRGRAIFWLTLLLIILGSAWFLFWFFFLRNEESTDDAYVNGYMINVSSVISGTPIAFFADNTDLVKEGQVLVLLDPTYYQVQYEKELSNLSAIALQVKQTYDNVDVSQLNVQIKRVQLDRARNDFEHRRSLINSKAIALEDYIHAREDLEIAELELRQAEQQLRVALSAAGPTPMEEHPSIQQQKANVRAAFYNLKHCTIVAPATGYVAQRAVEVGQWVEPNTPLLAIIPTQFMWVDANFKETQLTNMRIGQPATVTFDLYGGHVEFEGKVLGISPGTGSVFSLIPPQNATGNWIKIVQRLPVRIGLDPQKIKDFPLMIGLSANVTVQVVNRDLPMLAQIPPKEPIFTTSVFQYNFEELDHLMNQILQHYFKNP